jgi:hypothetical protein
MTPEEKNKRVMDEFKRYRDRWLGVLNGEQGNSVLRQLDIMTMNSMWFEWARCLRQSSSDVGPLNQPFWNLFLSGYVVQQAIGIRKLVSYQASGNQGSLKQVVIEMRKNAHVFSRRSIVDSIPLSGYEPRRFGVGSRIRQKKGMGQPPHSDEQVLEVANLRFDSLIGLLGTKRRTNGQKIPSHVFDRLGVALESDEICRLVTWGDKVLAHADLDAGTGTGHALTVESIHRSIEVMTQVWHFLCLDILGQEPKAIGGEYIDSQFQNIHQHIVPPLTDDEYGAAWQVVEAKVEAWQKGTAVSDFVLSSEQKRFVTSPGVST